MIRSSSISFVLQLAVALLVLDGVARADSKDAAAARALLLFRLGRMDVAAGRYAEALPKFADSQKLDPEAGTMLNLAFCYEKLGKTATAWAQYEAAGAVAHEKGNAKRENEALAQARRLEASLFRVVVRVTEQADADGLEVQLDNTPLPKSLWGQPTPVDPGRHELRATAAKRLPWRSTFEVDTEHLDAVTVPRLDPIAQADTPAVLAPRGHVAPDTDRGRVPAGSARRTAALVMTGAGAAALGVASVFALTAKSTYDGANCQGRFCTPDGVHAQSRAYTEAGVATATAAAGGAALIGAAILWFTVPSGPRGIQMQPAVDRTAWGVSLQGAW
jgi:hypothetical protein